MGSSAVAQVTLPTPTTYKAPPVTPTPAGIVPTAIKSPTPIRTATKTATKAVPTRPPAPSATVTSAPQVTQAPTNDSSRVVDGKRYDAYVPAATKLHQYYHYTCEFDAAWVVLKTNGISVTLEDQIKIVGLDKSIEPRWEEHTDGVVIYGGDIFSAYSGDYTKNFLARSTGIVIKKIFEHYGLHVTPVNSQESMEAALRRDQLVWIKTTADFKPGRPAKWITPDGRTYDTVLGNDHAAVVMGYSERGALIRDVLGPTSTNLKRTYEYEVPWPKFMAAWAQQQYDGLAVGK